MIIIKKELIKPAKLDGVYKETKELIAIMAKSNTTTNKNPVLKKTNT